MNPSPVDQLHYTDDETDLRAAVRALLDERSPHETVLGRIETAQPYDPALWKVLATQIGVAGLAVPESYGGLGNAWREAAVVAEELGRSLAPTPFLGSAVMATAALRACQDSPRAADLLKAVTQGTIVALALPLTTPPGAAFPTAIKADADGRLAGAVLSVADAASADVLLVPAVSPAGQGLYAVDAGDRRVVRHEVVSLDLTRTLTDLQLDNAPGDVLGTDGGAVRAITAALTAGATVLVSEQLGLAERCLETTVDYVKQRHQFGRPIGSFQAVKHRLADLWVGVSQGRAVARYAAACLAADDPDTPVAVAVAQSHCSELAVQAAEDSMQLHGGIGFTWEHPVHLYLKRAKADALALGRADQHRATLATLVDLPAT